MVVVCENRQPECDNQAVEGECVRKPVYMLGQCRKACCCAPPSVPVNARGNDTECTYYAGIGECSRSNESRNWMAHYCDKACRDLLCMEDASLTAPPSTVTSGLYTMHDHVMMVEAFSYK